ncbi:flavodoxin [Candidatus Methylocalor cossyra]|uniref:Flavodoxin n=1 Tax=Candidatus Methylocalor cossyra TaxID=3108543 RepID=A0ABM9NJ16_9GAMM
MSKKIGIFYGSDTGNTRRVAKSIAKKLGEIAAPPVDVKNASVDEFIQYQALILGTPTLGEGELPGLSSGCSEESWEEFLPKLKGQDLSGKVVALFGLGDQDAYGHEFVDGLILLYNFVVEAGAKVVGAWPTEGYTFEKSNSIIDGKFVGLVIDHENQSDQTDARLDAWLAAVKPALLGA